VSVKTITNEADFNAAIEQIDDGLANGVTLVLANNITLAATTNSGGDLDAITAGTGVTINGNGFAIDGAGRYAALMVLGGSITVQNLTISNAAAIGGLGGYGYAGGGGGAGLGGGLFVGAGANVTLNSVTFSNDAAIGGQGGKGEAKAAATGTGSGGGGGLGGAGGAGGFQHTGGGGGGIGSYANGQTGVIRGGTFTTIKGVLLGFGKGIPLSRPFPRQPPRMGCTARLNRAELTDGRAEQTAGRTRRTEPSPPAHSPAAAAGPTAAAAAQAAALIKAAVAAGSPHLRSP
jgi:hypothetical protein